jgi:hypothetical protein
MYILLADTPQNVPRIETAIDSMFRNSPAPTKTESEKALELDFISMLGNVKAFILSICLAVVFAILLVSANTMAMSIRERTREVAVMRTLGFTGRKGADSAGRRGDCVVTCRRVARSGWGLQPGLGLETIDSERFSRRASQDYRPDAPARAHGCGTGWTAERDFSGLPRLAGQYGSGTSPPGLMLSSAGVPPAVWWASRPPIGLAGGRRYFASSPTYTVP